MFCHCAIKCDDDGFVRYDEIFGLFYHHSCGSSS